MSVYVCVTERDYQSDDDEPEELAGFCLGHMCDFAFLARTIAKNLRKRDYPTLMKMGTDGEWSREQVPELERELRDIADKFEQLPPIEPKDAFEHTAEYRAGARSLYECFHDVDGENLFESLLYLCQVARENGRPIMVT